MPKDLTLEDEKAEAWEYWHERATRFEAALHKIAYEAYTAEDEKLTSSQPMMIWQLVALKALTSTVEPQK